jgi:S1-C subfamily serine protease
MDDLTPWTPPKSHGAPSRSRAAALPLVLAAVLGGGVSALAVSAVNGHDATTSTVTVAAPPASTATSFAASTPAPAASGAGLTIGDIYRQAGPGVVTVTQASGQGSGFVISSDGYILTNAHVVSSQGPVYVAFSNNDKAQATVVGSDPSTDVALLKVNVSAAALHPMTLGSSANIQVGDEVVAIGNPFGLDRTVTSGIISALNRQITSPSDTAINGAIQTDAAINHGNSGGPLLNMQGQVIGINSQIADSGVNANVGVGFAIPIDLVKSVADQLKAHGTIQHPWVGVGLSAVDSTLAAQQKLTVDHGAMVSSVVPGSPAAKAGLHPSTGQVTIDGTGYAVGGDIITAIDGKQITTIADLQSIVQQHQPGDTVTLTVVRDGASPIQLKLTLVARPAQIG